MQLFQGTPLLMQLFLASTFGLALLGLPTTPWIAAALALTLYTSAFLAEIWRGCVASIPKGQWEAADSLALSFAEKMRHVVLPQALRIAVLPTVGFLVQVVKGHRARIRDRLHRAHEGGNDDHQRHLPPVHGVRVRGAGVFLPLLPHLVADGFITSKGNSMPVVEITGLRKRFGSNEVLKGIDLAVEPGEVIAIIGKSGSGKSTLLRCVNGLERFDEGTLTVDGKPLLHDNAHAMRELRQRSAADLPGLTSSASHRGRQRDVACAS